MESGKAPSPTTRITRLHPYQQHIGHLIETTRQSLSEQGLIPVFITDGLDFTVFRNAKAIFESLPPLAGSADLAPDLDWDERRRTLRHLIRLKWDPSGEIDLSSGGTP